MTKVRAVFLILLLLLPGCRDYEEKLPPELEDMLQLKIDRPLEVVFASPQGETQGPQDYEAITVVFNQPMKALSAEAPKIAEPFKLEPAVKGRFRWKGSATVSFEPQEPLKFGSEYTIVVPAGIAAAGGSKLEKEARFAFTTPGPRLVTSQPRNGADHWQTKDPIFWIFDQPVSPEKVKSHLSLTEKDAPALTVRAPKPEELNKLNEDRDESARYQSAQVVAIELPSGLKAGQRYSLKLEEGLVGEDGPRPAKKGELLSFTTLGPLKFSPYSQDNPSDPSRGVTFRFSNKVNAKEFKEHLSVTPEVEIPTEEYDENDSWSSHTLYLGLQPNTTYTFTIDPDLQDVYGQKLGQKSTYVWKTGDRSPLARMAEGIGVLEAEGNLSIPMGLRNIDTVTYRLANLDRQELLRMITKDDRGWLWGSSDYTPPGGFDVVETVRPKGVKNELYDRPLDLKPALKGKKFGFVYYQVESIQGDRTFTHRGLAQVTNLAATGKFSPENSLLVTSALDDAALVGGVEVSLHDDKGRPVWRGQTGQDGRVEAPGWSQLLGVDSEGGGYYSSPPLLAMVQKGDDQAFIQNGGFGGLSPWMFDISYRWSNSSHHLTADIYSERGLYRPDDEVHLKGALRDRQNGEWIIPQVDRLKFKVTNSRDEEVEEGDVEFSQFGTFHHTLKLAPNSPTGAYRVNYSLLPKDAKRWGVDAALRGVTFRVEEFQPAQFEVDLESSIKNAVMGQEVDFTVIGNWLFGAPMMEQEVEWNSRIEPYTYTSEDYPGYDFGPTYSSDAEDTSKKLASGQGLTDNQGRFKGTASLKGIPYRGDGRLVVEGTIQSANRRSITGSLSVPVARGEFRIGAKPSSRFVPAKALDVKVVALAPDGTPVSGKEMALELVRREWNSVRKTSAGGHFSWVTEVEDKVIETQTLSSRDKPLDITVTPKEAGYYIVRLKAKDPQGNDILTESSFYAHGTGYVPWGRGDDDTVELVADKPKYAPGDTAKILIKSPFEKATALVTYERDLILHSYTTQLEGSAPVIEVPLTEEHLPNMYVSVMLFRGRIEPQQKDPHEDIGKPAFKIGYLDLPVAPDSQRLKVEVTTDAKRYGPKDEVVTRLKVTDSNGKPVQAELSLAAADVGVLNLINYQTPDLFNAFFGSHPLAVRTSESRLDVIGQRSYGTKGEDEGGGGGYNSAYRSDFRLTAVWEPQVRTDAKGEAEVRFTLPENLTTFRVMATAIDEKTRCGSADTEIVLTKPLIMKPSTPSFARVGDEFQAGALVANGSQKGHAVTVTLEVDGLEAQPKPQELFLKAGEEREVLFPLKATQEGTATLRLSGKMGAESDGVQYEIPLKMPTQSTTLAHTGSTDETFLKQPLSVPKTAVEGSAEVTVKLSSTILLGLESSVKELLDYPYGCLEQRISRITPMLLTDDLVTRYQLEGWDEKKVRQVVQENLDLISGYQADNGGLKVWPDGHSTHPYLTARVVRIADLAKQRGYTIKGNWLPGARAYLKRYLDKEVEAGFDFTETEKLNSQASALDALSRGGFQGKPYLNRLMDRRSRMSDLGRAHLLQAAFRLKAEDSVKLLRTELSNAVKVENATAYFDTDNSLTPWLWSNDIRDTGVILAALLQTGDGFPMADKVVTWLLEGRNSRGAWGSTATNAAALTALVTYSKAFEGEDPDFRVSANLGTEEFGVAQFAGAAKAQDTLRTEVKPGTDSAVELKKDGEGRLYYTITLNYRDTEPSPPVDEGMTVLRSLTDLDGKPVRQVKGGEIYKVRLAVIAPQLRRFVVLRDPIPAGLEVVKTDFATESSQLQELLKRGNQPSWMTFFRFEDYADRILLFADALAPGEHTYEYLVRAQTPGTYLYPAAQVEEMYHPELFGRTGTSTLVVK